MSDPLRIMCDRLIKHTAGADWETRFQFFAAGVQAIVEIANLDQGRSAEIIEEAHPSLFAKLVVEGFGAPPIVDRYQAAIYFLSADAAHKAASLAWQSENQDEVRQLLAEMPTRH